MLLKFNNINRAVAVILLCVLSVFSLSAQSKELTLEDLMPGGKNYAHFVPQTLRQLQWCGDSYIYRSGDTLHVAKVGGKEKLVTLSAIANAFKNANIEAPKSLPNFWVQDKNKSVIIFYFKGERVAYNINTQRVESQLRLPIGERHEIDLAGGNVAYTVGQNVWVRKANGDTIQVTFETEEGIVCGTDVHQREFGIEKGLFFSPTGRYLAFYRMDERMVPPYPIISIDARVAEYKPVSYPMAGMKSHHVTVGVYDIENNTTTYLKTGKPEEEFMTNISFSADEAYVFVCEVNRAQNNCDIVAYNVKSGDKCSTLRNIKDSKYVEPQHPLVAIPGGNGEYVQEFISDGFNHFLYYKLSNGNAANAANNNAVNGSALSLTSKAITKGHWMVTDFLGFADNGQSIIFTATTKHPSDCDSSAKLLQEGAKANGNIFRSLADLGDTPLERYTWKVNIKTGVYTLLTPQKGVHHSQLSGDGKYLIDEYSNPTTPREINIVSVATGKQVKHLLSAADTYAGYQLPDVKVDTLTSEDGKTPLYYRLVTPPNMEPGKKYPTIVYVYGGPHLQLVTGNWMYGMRGWDIYMALRGYVVFTLDNRGSGNRGYEFESCIHRQLGKCEMADQMTGVNYLQSLPFVDTERIGVHGWSFGGFMTTNLMLTYSDIFKVGVAGGPVIDWERYEIMYGERYMDTPEENPDGYKNANLLLRAGNLKGRLMLIHGTVDPVVVWQHSLLFMKACVDARTYPDYFVYPEHEHNVIGKDRVHLYQKITQYFDDFL